MPWEISIVNGADQNMPLGSRDEVIAKFADALPGVVLQQPPAPPAEILAQMPQIIRDNMLRPQLNADFETEDFVIQFFTHNEPQIRWVNAEVRGNGNPLPALVALCLPNGWAVINSSDKSVVTLSAAASPEWERFCAWRDKAISSAKIGGTPGE